MVSKYTRTTRNLTSSKLKYGLAALMGVLFIVALATIANRSKADSTATVIVQLSSEPVVVAKYRAQTASQNFDEAKYRQQIIAEQDSFLNQASAAGINYVVSSVSAPNGEVTANIPFRFNYVYNGVTLEVPEAAIPSLKQLAGVVAVHKAEQMHASLDHAVKYVRAPQLYGNPPRLTQFDTLDTGGVHGEGMIVAVIDTGIDWAHEMFGGDPTPPQFGVGPAMATRNQKVIYYLNLTAGVTGDDFGHGTHVAADIAGFTGHAPGDDLIPLTGDDVPITGVAPQARLMGYKTLSAAGAGLNPSTIMAIEDAVQPMTITGLPKPVPHVINLSLGSTVNDPNSPTSVACDNATLAGVTVVASAGNSGAPTPTNPTGEATIGSPGTGRRVLTVGANNDPGGVPDDIVQDRAFDRGQPADRTDVLDSAAVDRNSAGLIDATGKANAAGQRTNIPIVLAGGSPSIGNPVGQYYVFAGTVQTVADVPDSVAGKIAIARPSGAFGAVATAISAKGAAAALIIRPDLAKLTIVHSTIPVWSIHESDARYLLDLLASNDAIGVDPAKGALSEFPIRMKQGTFAPAMASFSSKGPVGGFGQIKPDVTAPGVQILSATARVGGVGTNGSFMMHPSGYVSASGTSFSSPITAGVVALIKRKNLTWTPAMIRAALINTATNLRETDGTPLPDGIQSLNNQGGGLIDAFAAANAKALMGTGSPGPTGTGPATRPFAVGVGPLVGTSPGNPDFSASYSFGDVVVEGSATLSQAVNIIDISDGGGAGTYNLTASNVRAVDGSNVQIQFTDAAGNSVSSVNVAANGTASFNVKAVVSAAALTSPTQIQWYVTASRLDGGQRLRMPFYVRATASTPTPTPTPTATPTPTPTATPTPTPPPTPESIEDDDTRVAYSAAWHLIDVAGASGGHFRYHTGNSPNHLASLDFNVPAGSTGSITYSFAKSPKGGTADVYLDGVKQTSINYANSVGETKTPDFKTDYMVQYTGLSAGPHKLEIKNMSGVVYLDHFSLENSISSAQPASGPGNTSNAQGSASAGQTTSSNHQPESGSQEMSVTAESTVNVPFKIAIVDPKGVTLQMADSVSGIATLNVPVNQQGVYVVKVINVSLGPLQFTTTTTPLVKR